MFIGNIVSKQINGYDFFNFVEDLSNINNDLPTLMVGYEKTKELYPNILLLNRKINDKLYWTFDKYDNKFEYENDLERFKNICINRIDKTIKYEYVNLIKINYSTAKKIINKLSSTNKYSIYINRGKNVYIYDLIDSIVYGVDLSVIDFMNINRKKIYKILYGRNNKLIYDSELPPSIKWNIDNKIIPYFYS